MSRRLSVGLVLAAALHIAPALAGDVSFVSVTGDDSRNCAAPATACRTFQRAHDATSPHGEIVALTPGDFRPVTITKSISVTGVEGAGVFGGSGEQIKIAAGAGVVYLTGLTLEGTASARNGVYIESASSVAIRKCTMRNTVESALFTNASRTLIEDTSLSNGHDNIYARGSTLVHRVVSSAARASAIVVSGTVGTISETSAAGSRDGIFQGRPIFMARSVVTGNSERGVDVFGVFTSAGDNLVRGNATNLTGAVTNIGRQ